MSTLISALGLVLAGCSSPYISGNAGIELAPIDVQRHIDAANRGSGESAFRLCLYYGMVKDNPRKELYWARRAAMVGHVEGQCWLGGELIDHPERGKPGESRMWLSNVAKAGGAWAKMKLGELDKRSQTQPEQLAGSGPQREGERRVEQNPEENGKARTAAKSAAAREGDQLTHSEVDQKPWAALAMQAPPFVNSLGMRFVPVPGTGVWFCIWETRVQDYRVYARANGGVDRRWENVKLRGKKVTPREDCPVVNMSWNAAKEFCGWLSRKEARQYRLPTDAEWSVAVGLSEPKGGTPMDKDRRVPGVYPWGVEWPPPRGAGNYSRLLKVDNYDYTSPVGSFSANQFGLYDLDGNVCEWCEDFYGDNIGSRVLRGASWISYTPNSLLSSYRLSCAPERGGWTCGFRVVVVNPLSSKTAGD